MAVNGLLKGKRRIRWEKGMNLRRPSHKELSEEDQAPKKTSRKRESRERGGEAGKICLSLSEMGDRNSNRLRRVEDEAGRQPRQAFNESPSSLEKLYPEKQILD